MEGPSQARQCRSVPEVRIVRGVSVLRQPPDMRRRRAVTTRALLTADDAKRLTNAARDSGCAIIVNPSAGTITIIPAGHSLESGLVDSAPKDAPLSLDAWRKERDQNKGPRRA